MAALTLAAGLGCGLIAGVFFAFSAFVMTALARLPPAQGIAAMQSISVVVINPVFGVAFFGTAAACVLLAVVSLLAWSQPGAVYVLAGSLLSARHDRGDDGVQRAPERRAGGGGFRQRRWRAPLGRLCHELDGVEPRTNCRRPHRVGVAHDRILPTARRGHAVIARCLRKDMGAIYHACG